MHQNIGNYYIVLMVCIFLHAPSLDRFALILSLTSRVR